MDNNQPVSRRDFITKTTLATAGLAIGGNILAASNQINSSINSTLYANTKYLNLVLKSF